MKNSDMPAMPIVSDRGERLDNAAGLSKREHFAGLAMQGMLSNSEMFKGQNTEEKLLQLLRGINTLAITQADALLQELEK